MKKITFVLLLLASLNARSQKTYVQAGLNLANITTSNSGHTEKNRMLPTFNAGLLTRIKTSGTVGFETGLLLSGHGSKAESFINFAGGQPYHVTSTFNPLYLELPLNLLLKVPTDGPSLFFNIGPYVAMGVGGKSKTVTTGGLGGTVESERKIDFSNDNPFTSQQEDAAYNKLKRFDYGLNLGGGLNLKGLILKANYGYGLVKISSMQSNNSENDNNKFRTFSISAGIPLSH